MLNTKLGEPYEDGREEDRLTLECPMYVLSADRPIWNKLKKEFFLQVDIGDMSYTFPAYNRDNIAVRAMLTKGDFPEGVFEPDTRIEYRFVMIIGGDQYFSEVGRASTSKHVPKKPFVDRYTMGYHEGADEELAGGNGWTRGVMVAKELPTIVPNN